MDFVQFISGELVPWLLTPIRHRALERAAYDWGMQSLHQALTKKQFATSSEAPSCTGSESSAKAAKYKVYTLRRGAHLEEMQRYWSAVSEQSPKLPSLPAPSRTLQAALPQNTLLLVLSALAGLPVKLKLTPAPELVLASLPHRLLHSPLDRGRVVHRTLYLMSTLGGLQGACDDGQESLQEGLLYQRLWASFGSENFSHQSKYLLQLSEFYVRNGEPLAALQLQLAATHSLQRSGQQDLTARLLQKLALASENAQNISEALQLYKGAASLHTDPLEQAATLHQVANLAHKQGDIREAITHIRAEIPALERAGETALAGDRWFAVAQLLYEQARHREAESAARQAQIRLHDHPLAMKKVIELRAQCLTNLGEPNRAQAVADEALTYSNNTGQN